MLSLCALQVSERAAGIAEQHRDRSADSRVVVVCRKGNDSQVAADLLTRAGAANVYDLAGGLHAWARTCDMPAL